MTPSQPQLDRHPGFQRLFRPQALTLGLILPLETHPRRADPTMENHLQLAQRADELDFGALWMRDVPFFDTEYNDVAQVFEPMVYLGYLAAATSRIALGTTGIVLPTREPMYLAKQATSLDQLSGARLVMGLSSGDRRSDYPMLGIDFDSRGERYRDAFSVFRTLTEARFPHFRSSVLAAQTVRWIWFPNRGLAVSRPSRWAAPDKVPSGWRRTLMDYCRLHLVPFVYNGRSTTGTAKCGPPLARMSSNPWVWVGFWI